MPWHNPERTWHLRHPGQLSFSAASIVAGQLTLRAAGSRGQNCKGEQRAASRRAVHKRSPQARGRCLLRKGVRREEMAARSRAASLGRLRGPRPRRLHRANAADRTARNACWEILPRSAESGNGSLERGNRGQ
eukprot:8682338-Pyramimonas_sp.AAC.1